MTPDDLESILYRAREGEPEDWVEAMQVDIPALGQALREAWAEIEQYRKVLADNERLLFALGPPKRKRKGSPHD